MPAPAPTILPSPPHPTVPLLIVSDRSTDVRLQNSKLQDSEFTLRHVTLDQAKQTLKEAGGGPFQHQPSRSALRHPPAGMVIGHLTAAESRDTLRASRRLSDVPILILVEEMSVRQTVELLNLGANEVLSAHAPAAELLATLRSRLRRSRPDLLSHGPLRLDVVGYQATLGGRPLPLSPQEVRLLTALVRRAGQLHARKDLAAVLWPNGIDIRSNKVDVTISSLRGKFRKAGIEQPFRTVRGLGLQLRDAEDLEAELLTG